MNQVQPSLAPTTLVAILAFDTNNRLAVRKLGNKVGLAFTGGDLAMAITRLDSAFSEHSAPRDGFEVNSAGRHYQVYLSQAHSDSTDSEIVFSSLEFLEKTPGAMPPSLAAILVKLQPFLIQIPYLHLGQNDFIYKFRPEKERNAGIYTQDDTATTLYQSRLCEAIKRLSRRQERTADNPVELNFGGIRYVIPSHFGFCLGVKNAIERAYETLAGNPNKRVFMLSELIHNPFVNEDLTRRGLQYLQTDKGIPLTISGKKANESPAEPLLWDTLTPTDIVVIPAFGATDEDKMRLVRKGIAVYPHDATCMLVEKVWKAAHTYGKEGYTVIIHGKHEHEETKATFSNTIRNTHALIVRNLGEAEVLADLIRQGINETNRAAFESHFAGRYSQGFDPAKHLERIAVVNQTTLLSNETLAIIEHLRAVYKKYRGDADLVGGGGRRDTLCYATQVNQDALTKALEVPLDAAFVIGGTNSSNTHQLYRLAQSKLGDKAFFIQSEEAICSLAEIEHYVLAGHVQGVSYKGHVTRKPLWTDVQIPKRVLITGGASCPDGIIQQVISRLNGLMPKGTLRSLEDVLREIEA